jgi:FolB domain-containing protein
MIWTLQINDLDIECCVGILEKERNTPQTIRINVFCDYESNINLNDSHNYLCYCFLSAEIKKICTTEHTELLEQLALKIENLCFKDLRVHFVKVSIEKFVVKSCRSVGIIKERRRSQEKPSLS